MVDDEERVATILGGRWDGLDVEYLGPTVRYEGEKYIALVNDDQKVHYLLQDLLTTWWHRGD